MINQNNRVQVLDVAKILEAKDLCAITKQTAAKIMKNPYYLPAEFFQELTTSDLCALSLMVELAATNNDILRDLIVITEMLTQAEGLISTTKDESTQNLNYFATLISLESLKRKGLVDIDYKAMSFEKDRGNESLATLKVPPTA